VSYPIDDARDPETGVVMFYWVSRDSHPRTGELQPYVDLWWVRPTRYRYAQAYKDPALVGAAWRSLTRDEGGSIVLVGHAGRHTIDACVKWCKTLPETDRELLVVGRP
jgi:hypothetical protein